MVGGIITHPTRGFPVNCGQAQGRYQYLFDFLQRGYWSTAPCITEATSTQRSRRY